jgi:hypothetical protein
VKGESANVGQLVIYVSAKPGPQALLYPAGEPELTKHAGQLTVEFVISVRSDLGGTENDGGKYQRASDKKQFYPSRVHGTISICRAERLRSISRHVRQSS